MADINSCKTDAQSLIRKSSQDRGRLPENYEARVRNDCINRCFQAFGRDVGIKTRKPPLSIRTVDFNNPSGKTIHSKPVFPAARMLGFDKKVTIRPFEENKKIEYNIAVTNEKMIPSAGCMPSRSRLKGTIRTTDTLSPSVRFLETSGDHS